MRETAELIYNTFKYQLVKYLGVFNLMYKYYISKIENKLLEGKPVTKVRNTNFFPPNHSSASTETKTHRFLSILNDRSKLPMCTLHRPP